MMPLTIGGVGSEGSRIGRTRVSRQARASLEGQVKNRSDQSEAV